MLTEATGHQVCLHWGLSDLEVLIQLIQCLSCFFFFSVGNKLNGGYRQIHGVLPPFPFLTSPANTGIGWRTFCLRAVGFILLDLSHTLSVMHIRSPVCTPPGHALTKGANYLYRQGSLLEQN